MTNDFQPLAVADRRGRWPWLAALVGMAMFVCAMTASAQAPAAAAPDTGEIDYLVGPIALYPDDLIAIILPASTSPLQIVQADRYLDKRKADPKLPLDDNWDDAVKSLLNYPEVVKKMSNDLDWTSALGEAVVADQGAVLDGIQSFRRRAQAAGNLKSDDKQVVKAEKEIIVIEPANPEVIYVPQYTPSTVVTVGVAPIYGYYPAPYPSYYYPYAPGAALAAGVIWGAAIGAAWSGNRYGYGGGDININRNTNINTGNTNINRGGGANAQGGGSAWKSNKQPGQVSSSVGKSSPSARVGDSRAGAGGAGSAAGGARASTQPGGGVGSAAGGARPSTQPSGAGAGSANRAGASGGSAFANSNASGRQTQANSSRGAASRSSASSMGGRPSGGGGGRAGGGGGGGRGGGGRR